MSLFKTREIWSVDTGSGEKVDNTSLLVGSLTPEGSDFIWIGSHDGWLKIYLAVNRPYQPTDLMYEQQLKPIIQLALGHLTSTSGSRQLGILHPSSITVWAISKIMSTETKAVEGLELSLLYEHKLNIKAHSMALGSFGGSTATVRDFICIQGMNGSLNFFEQETATFSIEQPDALLPMPLLYISEVDSFVILTSKLSIQCVGYPTIAAEKRITPRWTHILGVFPLDARKVKIGTDSIKIIFLTERNITEIDIKGNLLRQQNFEYHPTAFHVLEREKEPPIILICSDLEMLHVYKYSTLKWCCKLDFTVVSIRITTLVDIPGVIVLLSEQGNLQCVYLGTHPEIYMIPPVSRSAVDVAAAEQKLEQLQSNFENLPSQNVTTDLLKLNISQDPVNFSQKTPTVTLNVKLESPTPVHNAQLTFYSKAPIKTLVNVIKISSICDAEVVSTVCWAEGPAAVQSLQVRIVLSYFHESPQVKTIHVELPLSLVLKKVPAVKEAVHKLTIMSSTPVKDLNEIFKDIPGEGGTAMGFQQVNNESIVVTLAAAKASQRYRIQTDQLDYVQLVLQTLCQRIKGLSFTSPLPLEVLQETLINHCNLRKEKREMTQVMSKAASQYRNIYKKLLTSLKDASQKISKSLWQILDESHDLMTASIASCERLDDALEFSACRLANISQVILCLLNLMDTQDKDLVLIKYILRNDFHENDNQGWPEIQQATMNYILGTRLAKSVKDKLRLTENLETVDDPAKIIKLLRSTFDRITRGASLLERKEFAEETENTNEHGKSKTEHGPMQLIPKASKLTNVAFKMPVKIPPVLAEYLPEETKRAEPSFLTPTETTAIIETNNEESSPPPRPTKPTKPKKSTSTISSDRKVSENAQTDNVPKYRASNESPIEEDAIWDINLEEMQI